MSALLVIVGTLDRPIEVQDQNGPRRGFVAWQNAVEVHVNWEGDHPSDVAIVGRNRLTSVATMTREERVASYNAVRATHDARVLTLTSYRVGDTVAIPPRWGKHVAAGIPATVEKVDLDHGHACQICVTTGHTDACYHADRVELSLVWGAKPDGSAELRTREKASHCYRVTP